MTVRSIFAWALLAAALGGCDKVAPPSQLLARGPQVCAKCGRPMAPGHDCLAVDHCIACNRDVRRGHICGVTSICRESDPLHPECRFEVGQWHVHGVTHFCPICRQEVAANHMVNEVGQCLTHYCRTCGFDVVRPEYAETILGQKVLHVCGVTHFCPRCMAEVAENHVCDLTRYCPTCKRDVSFPFCAECRHVLGDSRSERVRILARIHALEKGETLRSWCSRCKKEVRVLDHVCYETEFCPRCQREEPLDHSD